MDVKSQLSDSFPSTTASNFLGFSYQACGSGFLYIANLLAVVEATGWGSFNNSNHIWWGRFNDTNRITNFAWGASVNTSPTNSLRSPGDPCVAWRRVCNNFLCHRHQGCRWQKYNRRNLLFNLSVYRQEHDRDGAVTQLFLFKISVADVSNCFRIACKISYCVTCSPCVWFVIFGVVDCQVLYFINYPVLFI